MRTHSDSIKAYHNVCPHRGGRLVSTPKHGNGARGQTQKFTCGFHAWSFNLGGRTPLCGTHPQLLKYGDFYAWSKAQGLHGNDGALYYRVRPYKK